MLGNDVVIREFNEVKDIELVGRLEKSCEILSNSNNNNKGVFPFASIMGDPLCRIRFFPLHVMLVAELSENGELVGVVRGCIKHVGTKFGAASIKLGCIIGLRVSPTHRRMGIGLKLVKSIEGWLAENGAHYTFLATEKNNIASTNLFTTKCNYVKFSSLFIFAQPVFPTKKNDHTSQHYQGIGIEKLNIDQSISFYKDKLRRDVYPLDMESILREKLSLGTWVFYFNEEKEKGSPISRLVFSVWNSCEAYKIHVRRNNLRTHYKVLHETLIHASEKIFPCLVKKMPTNDDDDESFGFLFLFGIHGEGERLGELMRCMWSYASKLTVEENIKDCKVIMTELGVEDSLLEFMPQDGRVEEESCMSCVEDVWYLKEIYRNVDGRNDDKKVMIMGQQVGDVFIDPRDF
ncbi:hypothetical protein ACFE04_005688 [Oxalis oulophora]